MNTFAITHARWDVRWVANKRIVIADFGEDLAEALRIYTKALAAGKRDATLRCKNVSIPPPIHLRPVLDKDGITIINTPLRHYNARGWWWCPYCMQLRKFKLLRGFFTGGQWVAEAGYHCPMCSISHRDSSVRKWNPIAARLHVEGVRAPRR